MKKWLALTLFVVALGCASNPRTVTYKSIAALNEAVKISLDGYNYWAVRYKAANPVDGGKLLRLDGKVSDAVDVYKSTAKLTLLTLKSNDVPTEALFLAASNVFYTIKGTNGL